VQTSTAAGLAALATHLAPGQQTAAPMPMSMQGHDHAAAGTPGEIPHLPPMLKVHALEPFVDRLPLPAVARGGLHGQLRIGMREVRASIHRDVAPARMWVYADLHDPGHATALAPLIEAESQRPLQVEWVNELPEHHFLPVDYSLHGCGHDLPEVRACVHLHGGRTPTASDGYPEDWYARGASRTCTYPLQQDAATLWYHDHAMGLNRLNIYAGLFGMAIVRDREERALDLPAGRYEIPLLLYDRLVRADGQLYYPVSGDAEHPWVPEFSGDAVLVNGKLMPYLEVEPRLYRFRVLNAANSQFFTLSLTAGNGLGTAGSGGEASPHLFQIGSDQGLLAAPVPQDRLTLAPAERADLLIDFAQAAGRTLHLYNGFLQIMQIRVGKAGRPGRPAALPASLRAVPRMEAASATVTRTLTLDEAKDRFGQSMIMVIDKKRWHEPVTETPKLGSTEIWEFVNLTEDTHPLHLHLVRFQVLERRAFDVYSYRVNHGLRYTSDPLPPAPNEMGWKDTVQCPPDLITRIIVRFDGYAGRYLYHCHILEHEANDMMRPFEVVG
jgi:spore coat protein A